MLALVIGAVPIALPLVMQVTMAIGAASMAKRKAIVTHLTALQEIVPRRNPWFSNPCDAYFGRKA